MKILRLLLVIALCAGFSLQTEAKRQKKEKLPQITTIYGFGVSQDLGDSIVYITNIYPITGATLLPSKLLDNHKYYTEQMKKYVEEKYNVIRQTTAFFFSTDRKKAEKSFLRAKQKMEKHFLKKPVFKSIAADEFRFKVPVLVDADSDF